MDHWKEITQLNVETIKELNRRGHPVVLAHKKDDRYISYRLQQKDMEHIDEMAHLGGYYYIVLPKLY